jgi:hypothetical protein
MRNVAVSENLYREVSTLLRFVEVKEKKQDVDDEPPTEEYVRDAADIRELDGSHADEPQAGLPSRKRTTSISVFFPEGSGAPTSASTWIKVLCISLLRLF